MKICQACERGRHDHCSGQVSAADMPCDCEHCWGEGGSLAAHKTATTMTCPTCQSGDLYPVAHTDGKAMWCLQCGTLSDPVGYPTAPAQAKRYAVLHLKLQAAYHQLAYIWDHEGICPCGARRESPETHPHVGGCPTGAALALDAESDR